MIVDDQEFHAPDYETRGSLRTREIADATVTYSVGVLGPAGQSATLTITGYVTASDIQALGPIIAGSVGYSFVGPSDDPGLNPGMTELINSSVLKKSALLPGTLSVVAGQVYTLTLFANVNLNTGIPT